MYTYAIEPAVEFVDNTKGNEFVHLCLLVSSYVVIVYYIPLLIKTVSLLVTYITEPFNRLALLAFD